MDNLAVESEQNTKCEPKATNSTHINELLSLTNKCSENIAACISESIESSIAESKSSASSGLNNNRTTSSQVPHSKPRGATYDGNVCMICSDRASGFHYGVLACEGCKGFFKRVCKEKVKTASCESNEVAPESMDSTVSSSSSSTGQSFVSNYKRHCVFGGNCDINVRTRNRCQHCRIQKCIELGMSKDGIKLGRRSKKFKQNLKNSIVNLLNTNQLKHQQQQQQCNQTENQNFSVDSSMPLVKQKSSETILNQSISEQPQQPQQQQQQQPIIAIFQDNKLIFKAIDILTAAASVSASTTSSTSSSNTKAISQGVNNLTTLDSDNAKNINSNKATSSSSSNILNNIYLNGNILNLMIQQQQQQQQSIPSSSPSSSSSTSPSSSLIQSINLLNQTTSNTNLFIPNLSANGTSNGNASASTKQMQLDNPSSSIIKEDSNNNNNNNSGIFILQQSNQQSAGNNIVNAPIILLNSLNIPSSSSCKSTSSSSLNPSLFILDAGTNKIKSESSKTNGTLAEPSTVSTIFQLVDTLAADNTSITNQTNQIDSDEEKKNGKANSIFYSMFDEAQLSNLIDAIFQAHKDTAMVSRTCPPSLSITSLNDLNFRNNCEQKNFFERGLLNILNETHFLDYFNNLIENAVLFAKNVPYFMNIHESDRITLLKSCVFEIICVRHASCYTNRSNLNTNKADDINNNLNSETNESQYMSTSYSANSSIDLATLAACAVAASSSAPSSTTNNLQTTNIVQQQQQGQQMNELNEVAATAINTRINLNLFMIPVFDTFVSCEWLCERMPQLKKFLLLLFEFYRCFTSMDLDEHEIALFCSYLLFNTDDQNLNDSEKLINYRSFFCDILVKVLDKKQKNKKTKSIHDKKSIANNSSADSIESILSWINICCNKLKELNYEHAKVLIDYKHLVQFPDLYAELYNL